MDELITKVEQWAKDKGLDQADPKAQFLKVAEEFGEIASAMARSNDELFNRIRQKSPILYRWVMNAVRYEGYRW
ncbi:TPA: hypothetical protein IYA53_002578 [Enterococcus faecium]|nr:hypothetical protein [Enterococcus faecium]